MSASQLLAYLGPALIFAICVTAITYTALRRTRAAISGAQSLTLCLAVFFLALTQHPFPDRATLDCSTGGVAPILRPFATFDHVGRLWRHTQNVPEIGLGAWLGSKVIQAAVMNLLLCAAIGAAFARHLRVRHPYLAALGLGILLSGGAEAAQVTGLFGLYPCPWRTFEVDDLIFNIAGLIAGFALMRRITGSGIQPKSGA